MFRGTIATVTNPTDEELRAHEAKMTMLRQAFLGWYSSLGGDMDDIASTNTAWRAFMAGYTIGRGEKLEMN